MSKKLKPVRGAKVRLLIDFHTRGGRIFRKGVIMKIDYTDGKYSLSCSVRAKSFSIIADKKDFARYFEIISNPAMDES